MVITNLCKASRVGFLFAGLAATTINFSHVQAMKRPRNVVENQVGQCQSMSLFQSELLDEVQGYILCSSFDWQTPEQLVASIRKLRIARITNLKPFVLALQYGGFGTRTNITPFQSNTFFTACDQNDIDSVMIIILAVGNNNRFELISMKDNVDPLALTRAEIDDNDDVSSLTRLQIAITKNQAMLVWVLITPLEKISHETSWKLMDIKDENGCNALQQVAATTGNIRIFKILFQAAGPYSQDLILSQSATYGRNILHIAASNLVIAQQFIPELFASSKDVIVKLIFAANQHGNTPLHLAARDGKIEIVKLIIQTVKNKALNSNQALKKLLDYQNNNKETACNLAEARRKKAVADLLKAEREALPEQTDDAEKPTIQDLEDKNDHTK